MKTESSPYWFLFFVLLVLVLSIGCATEDGPEPAAAAVEPTPSESAAPSPAVEETPAGPDHSAYYASWQRGPHADTYALEKGPNSYCARCHSPSNWDVAATIDPPPNCVSCKFPHESEMRVAEGNPPVPEEEWQSIGCPTCHRVSEQGVVQPEIAWFNRESGYYESLPDSTALCEKCHLDNETLAHKRELGEAAHAGFTCTDCHDPHDAGADCASCHSVSRARPPRLVAEHATVTGNDDCGECHHGAWEGHPMAVQQAGDDNCMACHGESMGQSSLTPRQLAHSAYHSAVHCVACHDALGLPVQKLPEAQEWTTFRTRQLLGQSLSEPYQSHTLQRAVDCRRCHYPHNPWQLPQDVLEEVALDSR